MPSAWYRPHEVLTLGEGDWAAGLVANEWGPASSSSLPSRCPPSLAGPLLTAPPHPLVGQWLPRAEVDAETQQQLWGGSPWPPAASPGGQEPGG